MTKRRCLVDRRYGCVQPDMLVEYDKDVGGSFMLDVRCEAKRCTLRAKLQKRGRGGPMMADARKRAELIMKDICPLCKKKFAGALELRNHIFTCKGGESE